MSTETTTAEERARIRAERYQALLEKWSDLVLAHVPSGRYISATRIAEKINSTRSWNDRVAEYEVRDCLMAANKKGTVLFARRDRDDGWAKPTPKLLAEMRDAAEQERQREARSKRRREAEERFLALVKDEEVTIGWSGGMHVEVPVERLAAWLVQAGWKEAAEALRELKSAWDEE